MELEEALKKEQELYQMMINERKNFNRQKQEELEAERERILQEIRSSKMDLQARLKIDSRPEVDFEKDIRVFLKRFENSDLRLHPKI